MSEPSKPTRSSFDLDLKRGQVAEKLAESVLKGELTVEVKRDDKFKSTGNIAIEYRYKGRPSGIAVTTADFWWIALGELNLVIKTERLKEICRTVYKKRGGVKMGEGAIGVLVRMEEILRCS